MPRPYLLERQQLIPRPAAEVFPFFADALNLEKLTPPWLHFQILTPPPIPMQTGTLIDYRLRLYGVPLGWRTRIEEFEPGVRFVDRQIRGPYRLWRHTHEFADLPEGTLMIDRVEYEIPWGPAGWVARQVFVHRLLDQIFDYRARQVAALWGE